VTVRGVLPLGGRITDSTCLFVRPSCMSSNGLITSKHTHTIFWMITGKIIRTVVRCSVYGCGLAFCIFCFIYDFRTDVSLEIRLSLTKILVLVSRVWCCLTSLTATLC